MSVPRMVAGMLIFLVAGEVLGSPVLDGGGPGVLISGQNEVEFSGSELGGPLQAWMSFPGKFTVLSNSNSRLKARVIVDGKKDAVGIGALRLGSSNGLSNLKLVVIDRWPAGAASLTNHSLAAAQEIRLPSVWEGRVEANQSSYFRFRARRGDDVSFEIVAARVGSSLDPLLRLLDASGREIAYDDDFPGAGADSKLQVRIAATGIYFLELRDTRYQSGNFILRAAPFPVGRLPILSGDPVDLSPGLGRFEEVEPNNSLATATAVTLPARLQGLFARPRDRDLYRFEAAKGQRLVVTGRTRSLGSPCDLYLKILKADGTDLVEANPTSGDEGSLTNTFKEAGRYFLAVEELNRRGGPEFRYEIEVTPVAGFSLVTEVDAVEVNPGAPFELKVAVLRRGYDGPIELSLTNDVFGLTVTNQVIESKKTNGVLRGYAPPKVGTGRLEMLGLIGRAEIDGRQTLYRASTLPALKKFFPQMLYPPAELDGVIAVGVK